MISAPGGDWAALPVSITVVPATEALQASTRSTVTLHCIGWLEKITPTLQQKGSGVGEMSALPSHHWQRQYSLPLRGCQRLASLMLQSHSKVSLFQEENIDGLAEKLWRPWRLTRHAGSPAGRGATRRGNSHPLYCGGIYRDPGNGPASLPAASATRRCRLVQ